MARFGWPSLGLSRWVPILIALVAETSPLAAQEVQIEISPAQATVFVSRCSRFTLKVTPAQPTRLDISIAYSDPSRVDVYPGLAVIPILPPADRQTLDACGRVVGNEPITITATLPASLGGATASAAVYIVNPIPELWNLWPTSITAGSGAFDLEIGQTFARTFSTESQVLWNGVPRPTSLHEYQGVCPGICPPPYLRSRISAEDVSIPGSAQVTVRNPPPGGGESAPLTFTILPGLQTQSVPFLSPRMVAFLALLLAASGLYVLRNGGAA